MNLRLSRLRGALAVTVLGLTACNAGDMSDEQESLGTSESALVCTCGATRYTVSRTATAINCSKASSAAVQATIPVMEATCPAGSCNVSMTTDQCVPVGSNGHLDGFRITVTRTFSCNEPANCQ